ncbi:type IV pilus assembly protein PilB [Enterococcus sp. DIV0840]|uniref:GspE/PulE family protein n=1 Tax=Enterococcus TaxID=1350 RepID=UPI001A8C4DDE|nr:MULTISPECIES: ATPase, T2SS/T4P/T4SS family [Enterococcus]MBO0432950.1 Flp pilus assembly complex ATPase component TadA [Enterococcus sp. DIV0849a]MBO0475012.1 Flp pilus assembly complex ATPase component TadA [Enterococcus ureasiticus]
MEEKKVRRRKKVRPPLGERSQPSQSSQNRTVDENGLLAIAVKQKLLTKQQAEEIKEQITSTNSVEKVLLDQHHVDETQLMKLQSVQTGIRIIDLFTVERETAVLELVPKKFAQKHQLFPVKKRKGRLVVAMVNPMAYDVINELRLITGMSALPYFASSSDIRQMITEHYPEDLMLEEWLQDATDDIAIGETQSTNTLLEDDSPIIKLVNSLLQAAVDKKASDIHFDPQKKSLNVRIRVDGELVELNQLPKNVQQAVTSRLKIISSLDITETRLPQDGRAQIQSGRRMVDLRVSILPTIYGEKVVIRIIDMSSGLRGLDEFNFDKDVLSGIKELLKQPHGIFLVTGPTGSGKSSTLYAALNELNQPNVNIITVEDPVEYQLDGVNQVLVNSDIGLDFAAGLRSILRQDPNVVMVGEIRDAETAEIAIRASMTGHMVLSTLHTNDSIATVSRLIDMGVDSFLVANALTGVLSQRLVRTICPNCKVEEPATIEEIEFLEKNNVYVDQLYRGTGCKKCNMSGFKGRIAIQELFIVTPEARLVISRNGEANELVAVAKRNGMKKLLDDGLNKVVRGFTTISEVLKATADG